MTTPLAQQLRALTLPHVTSQFASDRKRVSLLFDEKEAASLDRATVHEVGVTGLAALVTVDPGFEMFHSALFSDASVDFDRRVQTASVNDSVDATIESFLFRLSPFVLLRPAQKALEWLFFRFQIHIFNADSLLLALLPFHETNLFVRAVQTLDLTSPESKLASRWSWLAPLQKPGVPLSRRALAKRMASDPSLLGRVCEAAPKSLEAFGANGALSSEEAERLSAPLRPFLSFYASAVVGAIEVAENFGNKEIAVLLKFVLKGLKSKCTDYKMATLMIVSALWIKKQLNKKLVEELVKCVAQNIDEATLEQGLCCLAVAFQTQDDVPRSLPLPILQSLWRHEQFHSTLHRIQTAFNVDTLVEAVAVGAARHAVLENNSLLKDLLKGDVELNSGQRDAIVAAVFDAYKSLDSEARAERRLEASEIARGLERRFPSEFENRGREMAGESDGAILDLMSTGNEFKRKEVDSILLDCLHPNVITRLSGVQNLVRFVEEARAATGTPENDEDAAALLSKFVVNAKSKISEAVKTRLRDEDEPSIMKLVLESDIVMKGVGDAETMTALLAPLFRRASAAPPELVADWSYVVTKFLERLCWHKYDADDSAHQIIFRVVFPHLWYGGTLSSEGVAILRQTRFVQSHPLVGESRKRDLLPTEPVAANREFLEVIARAVTQDREPENQRLKVAELVALARADQPLRHISALLVATSLVRAASSSRFRADVAKTMLEALRVLESFFANVDLSSEGGKSDAATTSNVVQMGADDFLDLLRKMIGATIKGVKVHDAHFTSRAKALELPAALFNFLAETLEEAEREVEKEKEREKEKTKTKLKASAKRPFRRPLRVVRSALESFFAAYFPEAPTGVDFLVLVATPPATWTSSSPALVTPATRFHALSVAATLFQRLTFSQLETAMNPRKSNLMPRILAALFDERLRVRSATVNCFHSLAAATTTFNVDASTKNLVKAIVERSDAIVIDPHQLPQIFSFLTKTNSTLLQDMVACIGDPSYDPTMTRKLALLLSEVEGEAVFRPLTATLTRLTKRRREVGHDQEEDETALLLLRRFATASVAPLLTSDCLEYREFVDAVEEYAELSVVDDRWFSSLPTATRTAFFSFLIDAICVEVVEEVGKDSVMTSPNATNKIDFASKSKEVLSRLTIDAALVSAELSRTIPMKESFASVKETKRRKTQVEEKDLNASFRGRVEKILDYLQSNLNKIKETEHLVPSLLKIISYCLGNDDSCLFFTRDHCLAALGSVVSRLRAKDPEALNSIVNDKRLNIDVIVRCVQSPTATAQSNRNAFYLINAAAEVAPRLVVPNIVTIFTFVGEHLLRQDNNFTMQILEQTLDSITPVLLASNSIDEKPMEIGSSNHIERINENVAHALRVFVEAFFHMPAHRRTLVFKHLIDRMGPESSLWCLIAIVLESHVQPSAPVSHRDRPDSVHERYLDIPKSEVQKLQEFFKFWIHLCRDFGFVVVIETLQRLISFLTSFPPHFIRSASRESSDQSSSHPFNFLNLHLLSARQIRLLLFSVSLFINQLLAAFLGDSRLDETSRRDVAGKLYSLVASLVDFLLLAGERSEDESDAPAARFWKGMMSKSTEAMDAVNESLQESDFLVVVFKLLDHQSHNVRRKGLDLLAARLARYIKAENIGGSDTEGNEDAWLNLLPVLMRFVLTEDEDDAQKLPPFSPHTTQAALLCIKLLSRIFGFAHPNAFLPIVKRVTLLLQPGDSMDAVVRSSVFLTLAELFCSLKAKTVPLLNLVVPRIIAETTNPKSAPAKYSNDLLLVSALTALGKILETLPQFLSPFLADIVVAVSLVSAEESSIGDGSYKAQLTLRLAKIREILHAKTPPRTMVPTATKSYRTLLERGYMSAIVASMDLLRQHIDGLSKEDFLGSLPDLSDFFIMALDFRAKSLDTIEEPRVSEIEASIIDASLAMVLRMSEATFRPFYYRLFDWATEDAAPFQDRILTFYSVSLKITSSLKSLFALFFGRVAKNVIEILLVNRMAPTSTIPVGVDDSPSKDLEAAASIQVFSDRRKNVRLLELVVDTLTVVFRHDKLGAVAKENFDALREPLIHHLDNETLLCDVAGHAAFVSSRLAPCLAAFTAALDDMGMWKKIAYSICLKTKSENVAARLGAVTALQTFAIEVKQEFLTLLPEVAPFLAELMEDEDEEVEKAVQRFINAMEEHLGENLQSYFS